MDEQESIEEKAQRWVEKTARFENYLKWAKRNCIFEPIAMGCFPEEDESENS